MVKHAVTIMTLCFASPLLAQSPSASGATSAPPATQQSQAASSPAQSIGMFAYPKKEQTADQQLKDENECFASAKQQSGIDPQAPPPATKTEEQKKAEQQATAQQQQQQEAQARATHQQGIDTFKRAFSACMDARGYSIK